MKKSTLFTALAAFAFLATGCEKCKNNGGNDSPTNKPGSDFLVDNSGWEVRAELKNAELTGHPVDAYDGTDVLAMGKHNGYDMVFFVSSGVSTNDVTLYYSGGYIDAAGEFFEQSMASYSPLQGAAPPHIIEMPFDDLEDIYQSHQWSGGKLVWDYFARYNGSGQQTTHHHEGGTQNGRFEQIGEFSHDYAKDAAGKWALFHYNQWQDFIVDRLTGVVPTIADTLRPEHAASDGRLFFASDYAIAGAFDANDRPMIGVAGRYVFPGGSFRDQVRFYKKNSAGQVEFMGFFELDFFDFAPDPGKQMKLDMWVSGGKTYAVLNSTIGLGSLANFRLKIFEIGGGQAKKIYDHTTGCTHLLTSTGDLFIKEFYGVEIKKWNGGSFDPVGKPEFLADGRLIDRMLESDGELFVAVQGPTAAYLFSPKK